MTTIVAIKNRRTKEIVCWHDGRVSTTDWSIAHEDANKFIIFDNYWLLWCGSDHLKNLISHKYRKSFQDLLIEDKEDVLWFYQIYFDTVLNDETVKATEKNWEARHSTDYIIVTKDNIYSINTLWEFMGSDIFSSKFHPELEILSAGSWWTVCKDFIEWYLQHMDDARIETQLTSIELANLLKKWAEHAGSRIYTCNRNISVYNATKLFK